MAPGKEGHATQVRSLVRAARARHPGAFRQLVEMYMRSIYGIAYRLMGNHDDADDVAQETFVRAYEALERYDERYTMYTWLRTIATRVALNEIDKRRRRQTAGGERFEVAAQTVQETAANPEESFEGEETRRRLEKALATLPEEFRVTLTLRTYDELSYAEIAAALGVPVGTVMSRIHRARRMLRDALEAGSAGTAGHNRKSSHE
ncbi:MAG: RNA polymerase sigma factor [Candidatus Krumholzibacteriia bacterium]